MKLFQIAGIAVAAASLAACGGAATEENAASENIALETENLDLNAADLNAVSIDANTVVANEVTVENAADANVVETQRSVISGCPGGARRRLAGSAPLFYSSRNVSVTTIDVGMAFPSSVAGLYRQLAIRCLRAASRKDRSALPTGSTETTRPRSSIDSFSRSTASSSSRRFSSG